MEVSNIIQQVSNYQSDYVELTGGEPLAQNNSVGLASRLIDLGYHVLIETSGGVPIDNVPLESYIIMDLKCPSSNMTNRMVWPNIECLTMRHRRRAEKGFPGFDEIKFVVANREDYEWAKSKIKDHALYDSCIINFSPVFQTKEFAGCPPQQLVQWMLRDGVRARLNLQLHKVIWDPDARKV